MEGDQLYGLALDRFVGERSALAKALRAEGRREDAAAVAKLRKPSVAAWAVNQLVRTQRRAVAELFGAGDALLQAHEAVVSGTGDARALREAAAQERAAADTLVATARGLLTSDGHELSASIIDRVADTLHAAALDAGAREQVREGRLERELRHIGLGSAAFAGAAPSPAKSSAAPVRPAKRSGAPPRPATKPRADLVAARKAARAAEAEARRDVERAQRAVRDAARARDRVAEQVRAREEALTEAREALAEAEGRLGQAEAEADAAAEAHRRASAELERGDG